MEITVNVLAVILAAASTMVVGSLWYGKVGFGDSWTKLAKVKTDPNFTASKAAVLYGGAFLTSVVTAARIHMHDTFEGRRKKLTLLNI